LEKLHLDGPVKEHESDKVEGNIAPCLDMTNSMSQRIQILGHPGAVIWFTGLSGSGKTTLALALESALLANRHLARILDGDQLRQGLSSDLGFSDADRTENIRRAAEVARLLADAGVICLAAFISPFKALRTMARDIVGADRFLEVHVSTPLAICEQRDVKGFYARARQRQVASFTGVDSPYEPPEKPDIALDTAQCPVPQAVGQLLALMKERRLLPG